MSQITTKYTFNRNSGALSVPSSGRIQTTTTKVQQHQYHSSSNMGCCNNSCWSLKCHCCNLNFLYLKTPSGFLKILELIFVMICLLLARYGTENGYRIFGNGSDDMTFLGIGLLVGYAIIVPAIIMTYLIGANMTFLELFINLAGGVLFIITGSLTIEESRRYDNKKEVQMAIGCLCIVAGILFLIDFFFSVKSVRVSVVRTTTRTTI